MLITQQPLKQENKISTYLEENLQNFRKKLDVCLTKFKNNQILLNKICHRFLGTTKLYIVWSISKETKTFVPHQLNVSTKNNTNEIEEMRRDVK